jgi:ABC-type nitrate/sulfonate/bicarbonate transport system substrate-binding protein
MENLKLALDWTPNVNHIGFFVAKEKGFYKAKNIFLWIINPESDNYKTTPAKKVELGLADFALCPTESLISYQTKAISFPLVGISSIFKEDLSAISVLKSSGIKSPIDLDLKTYASYQARYEDGIVKAMVKNDGGEGHLKISYPDKLGIWERLVEGNADATWIFLNWEAIQAKAEGIELVNFKLSDYDIPYSYSPVIATDKKKISGDQKVFKDFLEATKQGYFYARSNPKEAAEILSQHLPEQDKNIDIEEAIELSSIALGDESEWGKMEIDKVDAFLSWLKERGLEKSDLTAKDLVSQIE